MKTARAWYASAGYQAILPLRTANSDGQVYLVPDAGTGHCSTDILHQIEAAAG